MAGGPKIEAFVRTEMAPQEAPPASTVGIMGWIRANLFSDWLNSILTIIGLYIIYLFVSVIVDWAFLRAVWTGENNKVCLDQEVGFQVGACWAFVKAKFSQFVYGRYPVEERWRVDLTFLVGAIGLAWVLIEGLPWRKWAGIFMLAGYPIMAFILLSGGNVNISGTTWIVVLVLAALVLGGIALFGMRAQSAGEDFDMSTALMVPGGIFAYILLFLGLLAFDFGFNHVETPLWGGLLVTLVVAITGIVASLPIGILLALGRRSSMPVVRMSGALAPKEYRLAMRPRCP